MTYVKKGGKIEGKITTTDSLIIEDKRPAQKADVNDIDGLHPESYRDTPASNWQEAVDLRFSKKQNCR